MKALYATPLADASQVPPVSRSLLTASEVVERWRRDEEKERKVLANPRKPAFTKDQNEVRYVHVHCHMNIHVVRV